MRLCWSEPKRSYFIKSFLSFLIYISKSGLSSEFQTHVNCLPIIYLHLIVSLASHMRHDLNRALSSHRHLLLVCPASLSIATSGPLVNQVF